MGLSACCILSTIMVAVYRFGVAFARLLALRQCAKWIKVFFSPFQSSSGKGLLLSAKQGLVRVFARLNAPLIFG